MKIGLLLSFLWLNWVTTTAQTAVVTRGPYLQLGTQTGATIRWRTDIANIGQVNYGLSVSSLTGNTSETASTTEHEIRLTGLTPDKQYFYSIGTPIQVLQQGTDNYFLTAPPADTKRKIRVSSFGDCGQNPNNNQTNVRNAFLNFRGNTPTDLWMLIGDNSYDGDDPQFQANFFEPYQTTLMKNSMLFAVPGNHDYNNNPTLAATHNIPYFSIFSFPTNAEAGGVASGTEEWYSFDYGPIHFVMLDGYGQRNVGGMDMRFYSDTLNHPQAIWLKQDLAATTKKWKIVYMHFPPYSQGAHNSETDPDLIAIRQRINPILERFGVDMVLLGHSHNYERSYPLHDQYGPMSDFTNNPSAYRFPKDNSTGRYDGSANSCPYKTTSEKKKQGTLYVLAGSAGALAYNPALSPHPVMVSTQRLAGGSFYFEVEDNRLDAKFIQPNSSPYSIGDQFTVMKDVEKPQSLTISAGQSATLTSSFISDYQWSNSADVTFSSSARSVVVNPAIGTNTTYVVRDSKNCVQDSFNVQVIGSGTMLTVKPGSWNDPTVWSGNRLPTSGDVLQVKHLVLIPANTEAHALRVSFDSGIKLTYGTNAHLFLAL
ncbi:metallophosphoesterase [Spirosoma flavum]|uniref:Metallophosphoesterase n=1 Tax=Spirosoma flavum TaxID=2048557 RepID=A0ABW6AH07_9BACT